MINPNCIRCNSDDVQKCGKQDGKQKYFCASCKHHFLESYLKCAYQKRDDNKTEKQFKLYKVQIQAGNHDIAESSAITQSDPS